MQDLLMHLCDSFQTEKPSSGLNKNFLGTEIELGMGNDLSFIIGSSLSGVRSGAVINQGNLDKCVRGIEYAAKQHLPLVVNIASSNRETTSHHSDYIHQIGNSGAFCMASSTPQETLDFAVISHRIAELTLVPGVHLMAAENGSEEVEKLSDEELRNFLGKANDHFESPTPSQQWVFGPKKTIGSELVQYGCSSNEWSQEV